MNKAKQLQRQHEKSVAEQFIKLYNQGFIFDRLGNDKNEPDILFKKGKEFLGLEVTDIWYRNIDAEQAWTVARGKRIPFRIEKSWGGLLKNPKDTLFDSILRILNDKLIKKYQFPEKRILILNHNSPQQSPLTELDDIKDCIEKIQDAIKDNWLEINNFQEVYIYFENYFYKIYPL